ncbi:hypothetical protein JCM8547_008283 [Rhodosporidiobolus lusitaniae]
MSAGLYAKGRVTGQQRGKRNVRVNTSLVQIEGVANAEEAQFYLGKRVAYVYTAQKEINGSKVRIIWGKVTRPHGGSGMVRAKFRQNLPPKAFGHSVRIMLYPSNTQWTLSQPSRAAPCVRLAAAPPSSSSRPVSTFTASEVSDRIARNEQRRKTVSRDFRTDTITVPTDEMLELMAHASRGDDVYGEDEDTLALQESVAKMAGKEAALFCVSGTMTNQLAIRTHLSSPPYSIVLDSRAHIHQHEAGGVAFHSGAISYPVFAQENDGHHMTVPEVMENVVSDDGDVHGAPTRLVCVENTLNGMIHPQSSLTALHSSLSPLSIPLHCDGARLWEVVAKTGLSLEEACRPFESVSLCLSKGLGAPVGSVLVGSKAFIKKATHFRKLFGGGIRQSGSLALAASYSLSTALPQLPRTHTLATLLARGLTSEDVGCALDLPVETNQIWVDTERAGFSMAELASRAKKEKGITLSSSWGRLVVHYQTSEEAVSDLVEVARGLAREKGRERVRWEREVGEEERERGRKRTERFATGEWEGERVGRRRRGGLRGGYGK